MINRNLVSYAYPYDYIESFYLIKNLQSSKDGTTVNKGKKLDGHVSDEEYLTCIKICSKFNMKNMSDRDNHYLKKDALLLADAFEKFPSM